jgi:predicted dehydrogenase
MCRKRGRIVLVGVTGLQLSRADFYEKELSFQVSCSYGPGRYDTAYEEKGQDYPIGFVRWTEQRNFEAVLDLLASNLVSFGSLVSHRIPFGRAEEAYALISKNAPVLGIVLEYARGQGPDGAAMRQRTVQLTPARTATAAQAVVAFIGAGNYGTQVLIPAFQKSGARLKTIASSGGVTARHAGRKFEFEEVTTAPETILRDPGTNTVVVVTRHNTHARFVCDAMQAGKHVFVEKPLAINSEQLTEIEAVHGSIGEGRAKPLLMVGFNRRFAPHVVKMKSLIETVTGPKSFVMTVNAGAIPAEHWTQDPEIGGGRVIGEGCHFVDLLRFLAAAAITEVQAISSNASMTDCVSFNLGFADGSFGTVHYLTNGHKSFAKERLDVFCGGRVLQLDNFRKLTGYGWPGFSKMNLWSQDKGQAACAASFISAIEKGGPSPIPFSELAEVTRTTFEIVEQLRR